jgi:hypothetical protein
LHVDPPVVDDAAPDEGPGTDEEPGGAAKEEDEGAPDEDEEDVDDTAPGVHAPLTARMVQGKRRRIMVGG